MKYLLYLGIYVILGAVTIWGLTMIDRERQLAPEDLTKMGLLWPITMLVFIFAAMAGWIDRN